MMPDHVIFEQLLWENRSAGVAGVISISGSLSNPTVGAVQMPDQIITHVFEKSAAINRECAHKETEKYCQQCGCRMGRRRNAAGAFTFSLCIFKKKKFCSSTCRWVALSKHLDADKIRYGTPKIRGEVNCWRSAKKRCFDPLNRNYHRYGGRGISMCAEWVDDFFAFFAHIGPRPSAAHSLDRFPDKDGDYKPGNVRWATATEQARNKANNRLITAYGTTKTLTEWVDLSGVPKTTLARLLKRGISPEAAIGRRK